jgi:hypothetical protein
MKSTKRKKRGGGIHVVYITIIFTTTNINF